MAALWIPVELFRYLEHVGAVGALVWAILDQWFLGHKKAEINRLKEDKNELQTQLDRLRGGVFGESIKITENTLQIINPPLCAVCTNLLFLRLSATFQNAVERLKFLADGITVPPNDIALVRDVLEKAINHSLWQPPLENPSTPEISRPKPDEELVTYGVGVYIKLISHMTEGEREEAIKFCIACCSKKAPTLTVLRREAVRSLLPRLLVSSGGDQRLIKTYKDLFDELRHLNTEEQKTLLVAVFGGLEVAWKVKPKEDQEENALKVRNIWEEAFNVTMQNISWAWEGEGAKTGIIWYNTMVERLSRADGEEKQFLRRVVVRHLLTKDAPSHRISYRQLSRFVSEDLRKWIGDASETRGIDRAIVPTTGSQALNIPVEIIVTGDSSALLAKLINFSLDDSTDPPSGRGAWATAEDEKTWIEIGNWRPATVTITYPQGNRILFEQSQVKGPLRQGDDNDPFWGFRIKLGPSLPPKAILPLKLPWDTWPRR